MQQKIIISLTALLFTVATACCQESQRQLPVRFVVQPELEIGKQVDFSINFEVKPDSIWSSANKIDGLELTDDLEMVEGKISESELTDDDGNVIKTFYRFYTYAKPSRPGIIHFPTLYIKSNGQIYKTPPFSVNVVSDLSIENDAVKLIWESDNNHYNRKDTLKIALFEYVRFLRSGRAPTGKNPTLNGNGNEIKVAYEETVDAIVGIENFEQEISKHFKIIDFDWNTFKDRQSIKNINGINYIEKLILGLTLIPTKKGTFSSGPSQFDYSIYKSNTDYFSRFVANNEGSYNITDKEAFKIKVSSNTLSIDIK